MATSTSKKTKEVRDLEKIIAKQEAMIGRLRDAKIRFPAIKLNKRARAKGTQVQVICSDSHGAYQDEEAIQAFIGDLRILRPNRVVHLGDALDCGGFLSSHEVLGVVPELDVSFEDDTAAANSFLDAIQSNIPKGTQFDLVEGNHENRINKWVCKQVLANGRNARYLLNMVGPEKVMNVKKRGIRWVARDKYYDGLNISGTIKLSPKIVAQHGEGVSGPSAIYRQLGRMGLSVLFGHTHRLGNIYDENLHGSMVGINTGCLCQRRPVYGLMKTTGWTHGYVVNIVEPGHGFFAFPVPIIKGKSYLSNLL